MNARTALVMAGGTGGHIFPGLAVADTLRARGWAVHWLGGPAPSMESQLVPPRGYDYHSVDFSGVRGKGWASLLSLPLRLLRALSQSRALVRQLQPTVVIGFGGYITFPAGLMAVVAGKPLVLHEQNSVAGMANQWLSRWARRVFTAFPQVLARGEWVGNPLREAFVQQAQPRQRFAQRSGPLRLLVVGGSLGAQALNQVVPQAMALIPEAQRPLITHQSGAKQLDSLRAAYAQVGVQAEVTPFIDDTATAFAQADLVICRAGASTVTEIAAVGVAALFVPFPQAVDDHQTVNARFLVEQGAGWLLPQTALEAQGLARRVQSLQRDVLAEVAQRAYGLRKTDAAFAMAQACEELVA